MEVLPPTGHDLVTNLDAIKPHYGALVTLWAVGLCAAGECVLLLASDVTVLCDDGSVASVVVNVEEQLVSPSKEAGRSRKGEVKALASVHQVRVFGEGATIIAEHVRGKIGKGAALPCDHGPVDVAAHDELPSSLGQGPPRGRPQRPARPRPAPLRGDPLRPVLETMAGLGHSTSMAAIRYQHAGNRDEELAARATRRRA